jgi:hypothetical protein
MSELNLLDIPDLSGIQDERSEPFQDGWYAGTILGKREFTDKSGNDRVFESGDTVSQKGDSRNIRLQLELKRKSDGKTFNTSVLVNYRPADLTAETIAAVAKRRSENKEGAAEWGDLFRPFMTLTRLAALQKIAGVRQLHRTDEGGLDLTPAFGKTGYFRIKDDERNPAYKAVVEFRAEAPKTIL